MMKTFTKLMMNTIGALYRLWHRNSPTHVLIDISDPSHGEVNALFLSLYALCFSSFCVKIFVIGNKRKEIFLDLEKWDFGSLKMRLVYFLASQAHHLGLISHFTSVEDAKRALLHTNVLSLTAMTEQALEVAEEFEMPGRPKETRAARLTKNGFGEVMKQKNKRAPKQVLLKWVTGNYEDVKGVMNKFEGGKVVLKPVTGSGSEGVSTHDNEYSLATAFRDLHSDAVVDEFIEGPQYCLLTTSQRNSHSIVGSYEVVAQFEDGVFKFDRLDMCNLTAHPKQQDMIGVLNDTLDAVGITCGACNPEVRVGGSSQRSAVIDLNPRLEGAAHDLGYLLNTTFGRDHNYALLQSFDKSEPSSGFPPLLNHGMAVYLRNDGAPGILVENYVHKMKTLNSYVGSYYKFAFGEMVETTKDYGTTLGFVLLQNKDKTQLMKDYQALRELGARLELSR